jgi:hypothetical protein
MILAMDEPFQQLLGLCSEIEKASFGFSYYSDVSFVSSRHPCIGLHV